MFGECFIMPKGMEKRARITISLDKEDYQFVKGLAKSKGLSFSDVARLLLKESIRTRQKQAANMQ